MEMKVKCTGYKTGERNFTINKIYTWKDNAITNDKGYTYTMSVNGTDTSQWELSGWYIFEKVENDKSKKMTDKEIWDMLKPKMDKNGIKKETLFEFFYSYDMLIKAVSLAYRCGYGRGIKGRPFKYNNVKPKPKYDFRKFVINENGDKIYYCDDEVVIGDKIVFISHDGSKNSIWPEYGKVGKVVDYAEPCNDGLWVLWEGRNSKVHNWRKYCKKVVE